MDYQQILEEIHTEVKPVITQGKVADYIPKLAAVPLNKFGMAVQTLDGKLFSVGDADEYFSIQSISKAHTLILALQFVGENNLLKRVGREPSGNPFNSLVQLEYENGIPRNPFINAGAMVLVDIILSHSKDAVQTILKFVRDRSNNQNIDFDKEVAASEKSTGFRNAALANFLKSYGNLENDVEDVLDIYFSQCSLSMNCIDLARSFMILANHGLSPWSGKQIISKSQAKRINSLMLTCGTYDAVGDFAYRVGLPGKSGVGGGIVALIPGRLCVAVWSPGLNSSGNSLAGTQALELFTTKTGKSIF
ncbi:glutaminase [Desulfobacula sp.]|jgi:glutaminase|uniref:glutaminase n=3 Tax=Desulfobacula sp. TaxID=2593537 RepID=UPI001D70B5EC|nr:glutaminase [Desulfobacula sp.]MBT3485818.1 glutaminase [Desulfobacula sp.]MBT4025431.1 glutaminase [Desulfobacula sp.]MBT4200904.1 glutaminase [Desulfobacula sp.]MBT4508406.1 glutaminase [Desulfobacula sp.]